MLAQYEDLAMKYNSKFLKRCSVSYAKQLLTPSHIFKFGWVDELSIDTKMKLVWGVLDRGGGAGGNPEDRAISLCIRRMVLQPVVNTLKDVKRQNQFIVRFALSEDKFEFRDPVRNRPLAKYRCILRYMFAGDFGSVLLSAFQAFQLSDTETTFEGIKSTQIAAMSLKNLQFFTKLCVVGEDEARFFNPYTEDWILSAKSVRNIKCTPRLGSNVLVKGIKEDEILVRIMALFVVEIRRYCHQSRGYVASFLPFLAGYLYESCGISAGDSRQYHALPHKPILFGLSRKVHLRQVSVGYEVLQESSERTFAYVTGYITPSVVIAIPETDTFGDVDISAGVQIAKEKHDEIVSRRSIEEVAACCGQRTQRAVQQQQVAEEGAASAEEEAASAQEEAASAEEEEADSAEEGEVFDEALLQSDDDNDSSGTDEDEDTECHICSSPDIDDDTMLLCDGSGEYVCLLGFRFPFYSYAHICRVWPWFPYVLSSASSTGSSRGRLVLPGVSAGITAAGTHLSATAVYQAVRRWCFRISGI